jgi:hypothetical protein
MTGEYKRNGKTAEKDEIEKSKPKTLTPTQDHRSIHQSMNSCIAFLLQTTQLIVEVCRVFVSWA